MLRVRVEIVPSGEGEAREIGRAEITNVGASVERGLYEATFATDGKNERDRLPSIEVQHRRGASFWRLIVVALSKALTAPADRSLSHDG